MSSWRSQPRAAGGLLRRSAGCSSRPRARARARALQWLHGSATGQARTRAARRGDNKVRGYLRLMTRLMQTGQGTNESRREEDACCEAPAGQHLPPPGSKRARAAWHARRPRAGRQQAVVRVQALQVGVQPAEGCGATKGYACQRGGGKGGRATPRRWVAGAAVSLVWQERGPTMRRACWQRRARWCKGESQGRTAEAAVAAAAGSHLITNRARKRA